MIAALQRHWPLLALTVVVVALWSTPVLLPLKILVVFLHELSHLIAVLLTGGSVETLSITPHQAVPFYRAAATGFSRYRRVISARL